MALFSCGRTGTPVSEGHLRFILGLVVAIPAVALFNYFQGRLTAALHSAETLGHVLLTHVDSNGDSHPADEENR